MKKLKGPELKMPPFVADLFYDLQDRRLLPLIAVIAVAIVAVPFLLSSSTKPPPSSAQLGAALAQQAGSGTAHLAVVAENPGLRDYRKRLSDLPAKDPFKQQFTAPVLKKGSAPTSRTTTSSPTTTTTTSSPTTTTSTSTGSGSPTPTLPTSPPTAPPSGGGSSSGGQGKTTGAAVASYTVDVRIVHDGKAQTRKNLPEMTKLPGDKVPVVMFMGASGNGKKALLLVSSDVNSIFGDAKCSLGSQTCDLLEVEPGFPETFVYGPSGVSYKINVLKIEPVVNKHP